MLNKQKITYDEISQIISISFVFGVFFKVCPREISETVSDPETKLLWTKRIYSEKKSGFKRF